MNSSAHQAKRAWIPGSVVQLVLQTANNVGVDVERLLKNARLPNLLSRRVDCAASQIALGRIIPVYRECMSALSLQVFGQEGRAAFTEEDYRLLCSCIINCKSLKE